MNFSVQDFLVQDQNEKKVPQDVQKFQFSCGVQN